MKRVVVTGIGTYNPLGKNVEETWNKVLAGESGIGPITGIDTENLPVKIAGEIKEIDITGLYKSPKKAKRLDDFVHFAAIAMKEAVEDSGLDFSENPFRTGICISSALGGMDAQVNNISSWLNRGVKGLSPYYIPQIIANIASGFLSMEYGIKGPNFNIQSACATGNHSIASALMAIQLGHADVMVTGGTEKGVSGVTLGGFCKLSALSLGFMDTPEKASRPFDSQRDGFVLSEGSAVVILEEYEHAVKRGAHIYCEVLSAGMTGDAHELVAPDPSGDGVYHAMKAALEMAHLKVTDINYINAHATSTPVGDVAECKAISRFLGDHQENICVGSTKSMLGHLLGATAALEAIFCIKAIQEGKIPGTINLENIDENIDLKCINTETVEQEVNYAMSNSFGFGGHNTSVVFGKI